MFRDNFITVVYVAVFISIRGAVGCGHKDFRHGHELMSDIQTFPQFTTLFQQQNCTVHSSINEMRHCYVHCNTGLETCVAFAQVGNDCYICDQSATSGEPVPQHLQPRFLVWKSHILNLAVTGNVDECTLSPCVHGVCTDTQTGYTCACATGYQGLHCDEDIDECLSSPCVYGSCTHSINAYNCACLEGYYGERCDEDIDECGSSPCVNGVCNDAVNGFSCTCDAGYQGDLCDDEIDECASSPCANGVCNDRVNGYSCTCDVGYQGDQCDDEIDECASSPCANGVCNDRVNGYSCTCDVGYQGDQCDEEIDECASSPCMNGVCSDAVNSFTCACNTGYQGERCEEAITCSTSYALIDGTDYNIDDTALSVSSTYGHPISRIRLHSSGGWSSPSSSVGVGEWVQADFGIIRLINSVSTQTYNGHSSSRVTSYKISVSSDGLSFNTLVDGTGNDIVFAGNTVNDDTLVVRNELPETVEARLVRLTIVTYNYFASLRWEIEGCPVPS